MFLFAMKAKKKKKDKILDPITRLLTVALGRGWWFCQGSLKEELITVRLFSSYVSATHFLSS